MIQSDSNLEIQVEVQKNDSRKYMLENLQRYFLKYGRFTWNDKAALCPPNPSDRENA